jgi:cytochrome c oxidase subunit 3/cytochrome o ubiquinol oxidase subunit 3
MWGFLGSESLFFTALITVYLIYKPRNVTRPDFQAPHEFLAIGLTSILATILLASSLTMVLSLAAVRRDDLKWFRIWLLATAGLGLCFVGGQAYEFTHLYSEGLALTSSLFGTTFFVLTGFHGTHVALGVVWLLSVFARSLRGRYSSHNYMDVELVGLYWHFVDLVWVAIFTLIYLI